MAALPKSAARRAINKADRRAAKTDLRAGRDEARVVRVPRGVDRMTS